MSTIEDMLLALAGVPALPGAKCRNRHHLFDAKGYNEGNDAAAARHAQAVSMCQRCPALAQCREWVDGLPSAKRPLGVVAGRIRVPRRPPTPTDAAEPPP